MTNKDSWLIRIGATAMLIGITLMALSLVLHVNLAYQLPDHGNEIEDPQVQLITFRVMGIMGLSLTILGGVFFIIGLQSRYFKPLEYMLYPNIPQESPQGNPTSYSSQNTYVCGSCRRQIPYGVSACPHCGVKQMQHAAVTLKNM
jgi:hypothetical protein